MKLPKLMYILIPVIILVLAFGAYGFHKLRYGDPIVQPMSFNHQFHTEVMGYECKRCHTGVESNYAAQTNFGSCLSCKTAIFKGALTKEKKKLVGLLAKEKKKTLTDNEKLFMKHLQDKKPITWKQIYRLNRHVYFSHRRHVKIAKLDCKTCHGDMGKSTKLPQYPIVSNLFMNTCLGCHKKKKASQDCTSCHK